VNILGHIWYASGRTAIMSFLFRRISDNRLFVLKGVEVRDAETTPLDVGALQELGLPLDGVPRFYERVNLATDIWDYAFTVNYGSPSFSVAVTAFLPTDNSAVAGPGAHLKFFEGTYPSSVNSSSYYEFDLWTLGRPRLEMTPQVHNGSWGQFRNSVDETEEGLAQSTTRATSFSRDFNGQVDSYSYNRPANIFEFAERFVLPATNPARDGWLDYRAGTSTDDFFPRNDRQAVLGVFPNPWYFQVGEVGPRSLTIVNNPDDLVTFEGNRRGSWQGNTFYYVSGSQIFHYEIDPAIPSIELIEIVDMDIPYPPDGYVYLAQKCEYLEPS